MLHLRLERRSNRALTFSAATGCPAQQAVGQRAPRVPQPPTYNSADPNRLSPWGFHCAEPVAHRKRLPGVSRPNPPLHILLGGDEMVYSPWEPPWGLREIFQDDLLWGRRDFSLFFFKK